MIQAEFTYGEIETIFWSQLNNLAGSPYSGRPLTRHEITASLDRCAYLLDLMNQYQHGGDAL